MMKNIIVFLKVMFLSLLGSCLMYFFFFIRGKVKLDFQEFYLFILEFTPMLLFVIFLSMGYKNFTKSDNK
ncbi:hypothetical protein MHD_08020 [Mannheimia granulomatis]|uniref:Uncharacterized protein n=1 Tax=Mannheimia granulomatis TaxID=85402 RepID=A0A011MJH8_9PAST|nr:hypothetical protein AK33_04370 [Mannheimia granulomatis]RGE47896.1 hypothetical protein MHD_08020 [Mannheimia granulomatis]